MTQTIEQMRTCFRCGSEIETASARICARCRKPRADRRECSGGALTPREKQIASLVAQAKLNKEIAFELGLSEGTVKEYLNRMFRKLGAKNRTDLAMWTIRHDETATPSAAAYGELRLA